MRAMVTACLLVALGSALGGVLRFLIGGAVDGRWLGLPLGTLAINVAGSLLIGAASAWAAGRPWMKPLVMAGMLGGFTTFSAFSLHTLELAQKERWLAAGGYVLASVALSLVAVWAGWSLGRAALGGSAPG